MEFSTIGILVAVAVITQRLNFMSRRSCLLLLTAPRVAPAIPRVLKKRLS